MIMFNTASIVLQNVQFNNDIFVYNNRSFLDLIFLIKLIMKPQQNKILK